MLTLSAAFLRQIQKTSIAFAAVLSISMAGSVLAGACGGEDATSGKRVALATEATITPEAAAPFTNAYGWTITLTKAAISVGPLYYFDGSPLFTARLSPEAPLEMLRRAAGVRVAHAHPGHYEPGNTKGQMLEPSSVDLLAGPAALPAGTGVSGVFRSARFSFASPPSGPAADALGAHVVVVEGEATKDAMTRIFAVAADLADVLDSYDEPRVEGCIFEETDVQANGKVIVRIDPTVWFDQAEFDDVPESPDGVPVALVPEQEAHRAFVRGLKKGSAYGFSYSP